MEKVFLLSFWTSNDVQSYRQFVFNNLNHAVLYFSKACSLKFKSVSLKNLVYEPFWQADNTEYVKHEFEMFQNHENQTSTPAI